MYGTGKLWAGILLRHPDLVDAFRRNRADKSWLDRCWDLLLGVLVVESGPRFGGYREQIQENLGRAGKPARLTAEIFVARSMLEGVGVFAVATVLFFLLFQKPLLILALGLGLGFAFGYRPYGLRAEADLRVRTIGRRLPYAIDLAVLLLGAAGTLREALEMISRGSDEDPLAEELSIALAEMRAGAPQAKALLAMAQRIQLEDLTALVLAINRGEETGAPMASALETQAELFRFRRIQRAEKLASEAPVKMMFPNMIIMIAVLLIVLGPVMVQLIRGGML